MDQPPLFERLLDYLVIVGPGRGIVFDKPSLRNGVKLPAAAAGGSSPLSSGWHRVSRPVPTILRQFPADNHKDFELAQDVSYFCQPEGCCVTLSDPVTHVFMLTDTESNTRTYGVCVSLPHLFDPLLRAQRSREEFCDLPEADSLCIQEWGVLSVCILTRHPFFHFFAKCLKTLAHFVEHFCDSELTWNDLIAAQYLNATPTQHDPPSDTTAAGSKKPAVAEVEEWILRLLALRAPEPGESALEVELEVDPAVVVCYPPPSRLPLCDLPIHRVLRRLGVCTLIEIYKLVLSEQKVVVHSGDPSFASECVLTVMALLYPLQYLFPVIPLLPTSMPTAENLVFVPTPFFIGVCSSFLDKLHDIHRDELCIVNLDTKKITMPSFTDQQVLTFPYCILQLQADIRKALDNLERLDKLGGRVSTTPGSTPGSTPQAGGSNSLHLPTANRAQRDGTPLSNTSEQSFVCPSLGEDCSYSSIGHEVDVMVRAAFVDFLFGAEILGLIDQHLCIYRLFTRPVVALKQNAFLRAYSATSPSTDTQFIRDFIHSQCVEYFFEWYLNPTNFAFEDIRKGMRDVERLSDKHTYYVHRLALSVEQVCLYDPLPESVLYEEMLSYKATHSLDLNNARDVPLDDEDWEFLSGGDLYDGGSEISPSTPSYFSDREMSPASDSPFAPPTSHHHTRTTSGDGGNRAVDLASDDELSVSYHSRKRLSFPEAGSIQVLPYPTSSSLKAGGGGGTLRHAHSHPLERKGVRFEIRTFQQDSDTDHSDSVDGEGAGYHTPYEGGGYHTPRLLEERTLQSLPHHRQVDKNQFIRRWKSYREPRERSPLSSSRTQATPPDYSPPLAASVKRSSSVNLRGERVASAATSPLTPLGRSTAPGLGSQSSQALDNQIHDTVARITSGQGFPWPKPASLKQMASYEKTRVMLLRHLEESLGLRERDDLVMSRSPQIPPVGVSRAVFKGVLELLKYLLQCVEEELQKEPEASIFSVFLILRVAFCVYLKQQKPKSVIGLSFLGAFSLGSSILVSSGGEEDRSTSRTPSPPPQGAGEETKKDTKSVQDSATSGSSNALSDGARPDEVPDLLLSEVRGLKLESASSTGSVTPTPLSDQSQDGDDHRSLTPSSQDEGATPEHHHQHHGRAVPSSLILDSTEPVRTFGSPSSAPLTDGGPAHHPVAPPPLISLTTEPPSHTATDQRHSSSHSSTNGSSPQSTQSSPQPLGKQGSPVSSGLSKQGSPVSSSGHRRTKSKHEPFILADLLKSPRFYQGEDLKNCVYLYKELVRSLGSTRSFLLEKKFWNTLFIATVDTDRNCLGWNEKTADMYTRYKSLTEAHRQAFGSEEDNLLSVVLHDLLVYMLMVGLGPVETTNLIHRFAARTRLATAEERLLQQTLKYLEQNTSEEVELSCLSVMALYSETHPTISYIVHYGVNVVAPVYKLQITSEVLILRRFPDEKISSRLWNDCISSVSHSEERATVSIKYKDTHGEYSHHFHTKQYMEVYQSLQLLLKNPSSPQT